MRADAARNREALLRAARELLVERGLDVPLEAVAEAAGVGVATLYRRFPDRDALLTGVALLSLAECSAMAEAGAQALDDSTEDDEAERVWQDLLSSFAREWVGVQLLTLVRSGSPLDSVELASARRTALAAFDRVLDALRVRGVLRADVTSFEVWSLLLAVARPLAGVPTAAAAPLVRRHLQVVVAGLRTGAAPLVGAPVTQQDAERAAAALARRSRTRQAPAS